MKYYFVCPVLVCLDGILFAEAAEVAFKDSLLGVVQIAHVLVDAQAIVGDLDDAAGIANQCNLFDQDSVKTM